MKILIICTGNTCRSQMAEGFLKSFDASLDVYSAGTKAEQKVNPYAMKAMSELGIDIGHQTPKQVDIFLDESFDYVITVCDGAKEICPVFSGNVKKKLHIGFDDPADAKGSDDEKMPVYRRVRDEIKEGFYKLYLESIKKEKNMEKKKIDLKDLVKNKYGEIARQSKTQNETSCCGSGGCCGDIDYTIFSDNYENLAGYNPDADLGLGCGLPTEFAKIQKGDTVLDLGSGAGNDCFVARAITGDEGKVTGLDFTDEMLQKANENKVKLGFTNVEFIKGDIEEMPLESNQFDVVISNCVLNLVPDKKKAFSEIFRVLKKRGHFCISDVVLEGELPDTIKNDMVMYAGCVSGAIQKQDYLKMINDCGFENIQIKKNKPIHVPDSILLQYLSHEELLSLRNKGTGIFSITVVAEKPSGLINNYNFDPEN